MQHKVINVHVMIINKAQLCLIDVRHLQSIAASDLMVWHCHPFAERIREGLAMVWFVLGRKHSANHSLRALLVNPIQCRGVYCSVVDVNVSQGCQSCSVTVGSRSGLLFVETSTRGGSCPVCNRPRCIRSTSNCCHTCCGKLSRTN